MLSYFLFHTIKRNELSDVLSVLVYFGHDFYKIVCCYTFELKILTKKREQESSPVSCKSCFYIASMHTF